jgi:hypothetical protein
MTNITQFLEIGFTHVVPYGLDHILFIASIYFLNSRLSSILIQCSIFTIAHSVSLGFSAAGYISPSPAVVEPLIALSILVTSIENIMQHRVNYFRWAIIFVFGLIHGMGFAGALSEIGLPSKEFIKALLSFNAGVELGQISIILLIYLCIGRWFSNKSWYRDRVVMPISSVIACIALFWTIQRIFFPS